MTVSKHFLHRLLWTLVLLVALPVALLASWRLLAAADFLYPVWHDALGIDATIAEYGPRNSYRRDFELTTREERSRLFGAIVGAIHNDGDGLEALRYHNAQGDTIAPFLRPAEITHLQDVARLVNMLHFVAYGAIAFWGLALAWVYRLALPPPPLARYLAAIGGVTGALVLVVITLGAREVFYALHTLVFPEDHQWFFYYEESLMTMLMKAPELFAVIAVEWLLLAVVCYGVCLWLSRRVITRVR